MSRIFILVNSYFKELWELNDHHLRNILQCDEYFATYLMTFKLLGVKDLQVRQILRILNFYQD